MLVLQDIKVSFRKEIQKKIFGTERTTVLENISFQVHKGECLGILGESGSGKSTLGRVITGLLPPDSGSISIEGSDIYRSRNGSKLLQDKIAVVFQDYTTSANPRFLIRDVLAEGLNVAKRKGYTYQSNQEEYHRLLRLVGLDETFLTRFPHELSGGQLQRVCIARALACKPEIILFDEAVSSLDAHTQVQLMDILCELKAKLNLTYIFITHDLTTITYLCDRVIFLNKGRITQTSAIENIAAVKDEYAERLLKSVLDFEEFL